MVSFWGRGEGDNFVSARTYRYRVALTPLPENQCGADTDIESRIVFSRIFRGNELYKAQAVTFLDSPDGKTATGTPFQSKVAEQHISTLYLFFSFIRNRN